MTRRAGIKTVFCRVWLSLGLLATTALADEASLPFGIRHYAIGPAENFELDDIDGEPFSLQQTRGRWVFLHFWASWCGPCREEMPTLRTLAETFPASELAIVLVNTAEEEDDIFTFLSAIDVELDSLRDVDGVVTERWRPRGLPTTFLIDPRGEVKYQAIGGRSWDQPAYLSFIRRLITGTRAAGQTQSGGER